MLASCEKETIVGGGSIATEQRNVSNFTKIEVEGKINVIIEHSASFKVAVKSYQNLLPVLETKLIGDALHIGYRTGTNIINDRSEVRISLPLLQKLTTTGDSEINIISGNSSNFEAHIVGSSLINAFNFSTQLANIDIEGNGFASIAVADRLKVKITGNGTVYYKGSPLVTSNVIGNGIIEKK